MNISSLAITTLPENSDLVFEDLKSGNLCEYHGHKEGKIPDWLNDKNSKAEDIKYNGRLPI